VALPFIRIRAQPDGLPPDRRSAMAQPPSPRRPVPPPEDQPPPRENPDEPGPELPDDRVPETDPWPDEAPDDTPPEIPD
jgi:hypothetical protein